MNPVTIDLDEPTTEDKQWLRESIEDFVKETDSAVGQRILDNWEVESNHFVKVLFPILANSIQSDLIFLSGVPERLQTRATGIGVGKAKGARSVE